MAGTVQSPVALNMAAIAGQWSLSALLNRSSASGDSNSPRPLRWLPCKPARVSDRQRAALTGYQRQQAGDQEVSEGVVGLRLYVREHKRPVGVHNLSHALVVLHRVRAQREQVPATFVAHLVCAVALHGNTTALIGINGSHEVVHYEPLTREHNAFL